MLRKQHSLDNGLLKSDNSESTAGGGTDLAFLYTLSTGDRIFCRWNLSI